MDRPEVKPRQPADHTPAFTAKHQRGLLDFWEVYQAHYDSVQEEAMVVALDHPEFGPLVRGMTRSSKSQEANQRSRGCSATRSWMASGNAYLEDTRAQGPSTRSSA